MSKSTSENASIVQTLFDLFFFFQQFQPQMFLSKKFLYRNQCSMGIGIIILNFVYFVDQQNNAMYV